MFKLTLYFTWLAFFYIINKENVLPTYTFKDITTEEQERFEISMRIAELDDYKLANPHLQQVITSAPSIGDAHRLGRIKPDNGFRDVLRKVKEHHPGSRKKDGAKNTINTW